MKINKTASARWTGGLKDGKGTISTQSGALKEQPYGFNTRFEGKEGTNPEELVGAAHAGCFTMALSKIIGEAGFTAEKLETKADVTLEKVNESFEVTNIALSLTASVPGMETAKFNEAATKAKENCPISKLFKTNITLETTLN